MQKFTSSSKYQDYIKDNQTKINSLNEDMKKYWTPELKQLQKELENLQKEVYTTTPVTSPAK
jgi:hypothetical protein